ncbi:ATP synthase F1 subunit gamma [Paraburkholderia phosphatilytica]|uniref:ATP synthase F1 subunit gamma n=1 Tax=Paraburkholderia phosphatilytica TaxID=2282883 RepID=UPI000E4C0EE3|nr:ATP synthase F1 subunit gamma [Paraburkholderia phosphatilytica]
MHTRAIRSKMNSTHATRKITRAMETMARTKMAAAQRRARELRPYAQRVRQMAQRMMSDKPDYASLLTQQREHVKRVGLVVVSTDRGLCGPLNTRLLMRCVDALEGWNQRGVEAEFSVIGARALMPLLRHGANVVARAGTIADAAHFDAILGAILVPLDAFIHGELDEVWVAYNRLTSAIAYEPRVERLLPIAEFERPAGPTATYLYEPGQKAVIDTLLLRYVEACFYQAVVENDACEQCARMFSMQTATENADRMLRDLRHLYQKMRQTQITTEICEIVAGAAAV